MKSDPTDTYSEIEEKRTSKLGYLILGALFIFLIITGQTIYHDIAQIPDQPIPPSYCANMYTESLTGMRYYDHRCTYSEIDKKYGIDTLITSLEPDIKTISQYNQQLSEKNSQAYANDMQLNDLLQQYDISLQETMANEDALMDKPEIKRQITTLRTNSDNINAQIKELEAKRSAIIERIDPKLKELKIAYDKADEEYKSKLVYYNIKTFILKLLFILPLFLIFLRYYLRYKKKDSPYTIIITAIFFATTILFLEIVLILLYDIIPKGLIEKILNIFLNSSILRYVLYYTVVIIVILILGGIVYYIQKKIYDPKRVAIRSLRNNKCPNCSFDLSLSDSHCPYCGRQIKTKCPHCKNYRYRDLAYCPSCGKRNDTNKEDTK
ncbi:MAG: zinc ribbon domain-containing protein [archaeon]